MTSLGNKYTPYLKIIQYHLTKVCYKMTAQVPEKHLGITQAREQCQAGLHMVELLGPAICL